MRRKGARDETRFLFVLCLELLKHCRHGSGIVTGGIHVLNTELVSLLFSTAAELHKDAEQSDTSCVLINHSRNATQKYRSTECGIFKETRFRLILDGVSCSYVSNLVSHYAS